MRTSLLRTTAFGLAALACFLTAGPPPRAGLRDLDPIRLLGPLPGIALPFLWQEWGRARKDYDLKASLAALRWISRIRPDLPALHEGLAWQTAYDLADLEADPEARAARLSQALRVLDEAARLRPEDPRPLALGAFMLGDLCRPARPGGSELARAFEDSTGTKPLDLARTRLELALGRRPELRGIKNLSYFLAEGCDRHALQALAAGHPKAAALSLARAARILQGAAPRRAALRRTLAGLLERGGVLPADLLPRLNREPILRRIVRHWPGGR